MQEKKLGGWLLFFAVTKWLMIVANGFLTISLINGLMGQGIDWELFKILLCCLVSCVAEFVQFMLLKYGKFLNWTIINKDSFLGYFYLTEVISAIAMCIYSNIYSGTWISTLLAQAVYVAIWGTYLYKSKRVDAYRF